MCTVTDYRMVARHVRYWRGAMHKWSTVYPMTGTLPSGDYASAIAVLKTFEQGINWPGTGVVEGGLYEIALYDQSSGGVPVGVASYFDETVYADWVAYLGTFWVGANAVVNPSAEVALQWSVAAGLSSSGKPVHFRKWFHAVPVSVAAAGAQDVTSGSITAMEAGSATFLNALGALGAPLGRGSRLAATVAVVNPFFGNHQMPRGRRRPALVSASGKTRFPAGLLTVPGSDGSLS